MDAQSEFKARLERDVARTLRHLQLSGADVSALNGETRLIVKDGQLVAVEMPESTSPPSGMTRHAPTEVGSDAVEFTSPPAPLQSGEGSSTNTPPYQTARERRNRAKGDE